MMTRLREFFIALWNWIKTFCSYMWTNYKNIILAVSIGIFVGVTFCHTMHRRNMKQINEVREEVHKVDSIVKLVHDTIKIDKPRLVNKKILRRDTVRMRSVYHDTVLVEAPLVEKEYKESDYYAKVSGYVDCNLDTIALFPQTKEIIVHDTRTITETKIETKYKDKPWSIGVGAGYGFNPVSGKFEPNFSVGLHYNIWSFGKRR